MRKLTIKREKSFVGCAAKMQIFIEDKSSDELKMPIYSKDEAGEEKVEYVYCRKLGALKSGEEATFEIGNEAAKIFVIADMASKDFCNDCYQLAEGDEDVSLSGKNVFNPAAGNAFRFNGNDSNIVTLNRKKSTGKGVLVVIAAAIIGLLIGYFGMMGIMSGIGSQEKVFVSGDMKITLNEGFQQQYPVGYSAVYSSKNVAIFVTTTAGMESNVVYDTTAAEYAELVINSSKITDAQVITEGDLTYFVYDSGESFTHYTYVYKNGEDFWLLDFAVESKLVKKYSNDIAKWAGSVEFN